MDLGIRRLTSLILSSSSFSLKSIINANRKNFSIYTPKSFMMKFETEAQFNLIFSRKLASDANLKDIEKNLAKKEKIKSKALKLEADQKVILISEDSSISIQTLDEAQRIAKKRNALMKLVDSKDENLKTEKKVYKLTSKHDLLNTEEEATKKPKNEEKTLLLKSNISSNDVLAKIKSLLKWVEKGIYVRVFISNIGKGDPENVYKIIENSIKDTPHRIIQKVVKDSQIKFQVNPPKKAKSVKKDNELDQSNEKENKSSS